MRYYNDIIGIINKYIFQHSRWKEAKITLYIKPLSDIMSGAKRCGLTEEIIYQN